jgi:hypothetical protein
LVFGYRRLKVFKQPEKAGDSLFHVYLLGTSSNMAVRFPTQQLQPMTAKPENVEAVKVATEYLAEEFTIIAFKLLSLKSGYTCEVSWTYR